jgi:hypothetical protein
MGLSVSRPQLTLERLDKEYVRTGTKGIKNFRVALVVSLLSQSVSGEQRGVLLSRHMIFSH